MSDDPFELWLGRMSADRRLTARLRGLVNRVGGRRPRSQTQFAGSRIGQGRAVLLGPPSWRSGSPARRVVVKTRIVRLGPKGLAKAAAHLRYLERDGTTRGGARGTLYGPEADAADGKAFLERGAGERHQFRFIVAPEDGAQYQDLKPLVRRWMRDVEQDLGTRLDWVAIDHFDTGHPHAHVIVRGKDARGADLVIAREYISHGLRERARRLVELDLGPRSPAELLGTARREVEAERLTAIDRRLIRSVGDDGLARADHPDPVEQTLRAGRLRMLGQLGLATEAAPGDWQLDAGLQAKLRRMGERGDIIRIMQQALTAAAPDRTPADYAIHSPGAAPTAPIVGRVVARGLSDEHAERHYLIVDAVDGLSHYIDVGTEPAAAVANGIVRVTLPRTAPRAVDRTVADVAAENGGRYSVDLHLRHDPRASEAFAEAHVRRLEAIRRASRAVEREADGSWRIAPGHLARVEAYECQRAARYPVEIETLSAAPLADLPSRNGVTWLDRELAGGCPTELGRGFGAEVRRALAARLQWLVGEGLAQRGDAGVQLVPGVLAQLRQRELRQAALVLSDELGLRFTEARAGERIEGICRQAVAVGDARYALIERERSFTLVPWRPMLKRAIGKPVAGLAREGAISWSIGRGRSGPTIGT